jgi:hypothetical protein
LAGPASGARSTGTASYRAHQEIRGFLLERCIIFAAQPIRPFTVERISPA